jgi:transglutaminase-like putative cysteine protease
VRGRTSRNRCWRDKATVAASFLQSEPLTGLPSAPSEHRWQSPASSTWRRVFGLIPYCSARELLTRLSKGINHGFLYRRREAKGIQQPVETLRLGHGSCRDFAMLMIEAARSLGFAARFASGYLAVPLDDPKELTSGSARGSTHAWAQIYLPGTGWIDFDPTIGSVGKIGLVTVAVVRDPRHAIPLHGTFIGVPSDHLGMEVQVSVTSGTPGAIWATPHRSTWPQFHQSL